MTGLRVPPASPSATTRFAAAAGTALNTVSDTAQTTTRKNTLMLTPLLGPAQFANVPIAGHANVVSAFRRCQPHPVLFTAELRLLAADRWTERDSGA